MTALCPDPRLAEKVLRIILKTVAGPTLKPAITGVLRDVLMDELTIASPRLRQQLLEQHEAALEWWLWDYLIARPEPIYGLTTDEG
jgi:hypothetical protein